MSWMHRPARTARRHIVRGAAAVLATGLTGGALLLALPSGAGLPPDVRVIDSHAAAAAVGLLSRVPAESDGGVLYSSTALTLDKTQARAAGFTGGDLAETFFESSTDKYRNPTLINAQYPPTATAPAESSFDAAAAPQAAVAGGLGHLHAVATDTPSTAAEATGGDAALGDVTVGASSSTSSGELAADGTLVTRARSTATDIRIAKVLTLAGATTVAEARVPRTGAPTTALDVKLTGAALGGIPAEITPDGIRISDKAAASPVTIAQFNAALAQLQEKGITVVAAPLIQETAAGAARAAGGGLTVRYKVADQIGGDEQLTLAPASARSAVARRAAEPPALDESTPPAPDGVAPAPGTVPPPPAAGPGTPTRSGTEPLSTTAGLPNVSYDFGSGGEPGPGAGSAPTGPSPGSTAASTLSTPNAPGSAAALPTAHRGPEPARRLRTGYALVLLAAFAGVAAVTAQFKIRPA